MIKTVFAFLLIIGSTLAAQEVFSDRIKGLRVYGTAQAGLPVAGLQSRPITIEFDVAETEPPDFHLRVKHCDKDWNVTATSFVNDEMLDRSKGPLHFERAPDGAQFYRHHYAASIPGMVGLEKLSQSGNYVFEILDEEWKSVLARGRFYAVETILSPSMRISNRSLPSEINPYNQVLKIEVRFALPGPDALKGEVFYPIKLKVVDIVRNRQLCSTKRIDVDDQDPNTFVDGFGTSTLNFIIDNVQPGSSYRQVDVRNVTDYPEGADLTARRGADVSRFLQPPGRDGFGVSSLTSGSRYADYVSFRFQLASETRQFDSVFVVGDFDGWRPSAECLMTYDEGMQRYSWKGVFRRGEYDYQYVAGLGDWISLEGNDWRTVSIYSALIYYHDDRFGGFDRIIGFAQGRSPGGNEPTSE